MLVKKEKKTQKNQPKKGKEIQLCSQTLDLPAFCTFFFPLRAEIANRGKNIFSFAFSKIEYFPSYALTAPQPGIAFCKGQMLHIHF